MGEGEFQVELRERDPGPTGRDEAVFLVRPNAGLAFGPVAETASGGELSRVALALAAVAGGETLVLDEIDAGIGGVTAHRVAETLRRLAGRAQVLTITHLPQIASVADQHLRVEKVPGDPTHTRIAALSRRRAARRARAHARRRGVRQRGRRGARAVTELVGTARLGRRTKDLVKRLGPGTLRSSTMPTSTGSRPRSSPDRVSARSSTSRRRRSGRFPNPGPLELVRAGVRLVDAPGAALFDVLSDGETVAVRGRQVWRNGTLLAEGTVLDAASARAALADQQGRVSHALEAFADNTLRHLREEAGRSPTGSSSRR